MKDLNDLEKLCEAVLKALPRLATDPSLTPMERRFLEEMEAVVADE